MASMNENLTLLESITSIIEDRKASKIYPYCAMLSDVRKLCGLSDTEFREEVKRLKRAGKIEIKQTINSYSFYLL